MAGIYKLIEGGKRWKVGSCEDGKVCKGWKVKRLDDVKMRDEG